MDPQGWFRAEWVKKIGSSSIASYDLKSQTMRNTWGTHLGDTKLVASIDERPVFESMSINLIFVCVGTMACKDIMIC